LIQTLISEQTEA